MCHVMLNIMSNLCFNDCFAAAIIYVSCGMCEKEKSELVCFLIVIVKSQLLPKGFIIRLELQSKCKNIKIKYTNS